MESLSNIYLYATRLQLLFFVSLFLISTSSCDTQAIQAPNSGIDNGSIHAPQLLEPLQLIEVSEGQSVEFNISATDLNRNVLYYIAEALPNQGAVSDCMSLPSSTGQSDNTCIFTPNSNQENTVTFSYKVYDGTHYSDIGHVVFTFKKGSSNNHAPVAGENQTIEVVKWEAVDFSLHQASDEDGDDLIYQIVTDSTNGKLSHCMSLNASSGVSDISCTYTSQEGQILEETVVYKVSDGKENSENVSLTFKIIDPSNQNALPQVGGNQIVEVEKWENKTFTVNIATDADGDDLMYQVVNDGSGGRLQGCMNLFGTSRSDDRSCVYVASSSQNSLEDIIEYHVSDGKGVSEKATLTIKIVNPENPAPVIGSAQIIEIPSVDDQAVISDLSFTIASATDPEGDALTYELVSSTLSSNESVSNCLNFSGSMGEEDRSCLYQGSSGRTTQSIQYRARDMHGAVSQTATLTFQVLSASPNQAPQAADQTITIPARSSGNISNMPFMIEMATDPDGDQLSYQLVENNTPNTVVISHCLGLFGADPNDLSCNYSASTGRTSGTLKYRVTDEHGLSSPLITVTLLVQDGM